MWLAALHGRRRYGSDAHAGGAVIDGQHFAGGLRLLLVEFVGWRADLQKSLLALAAAFTVAFGLLLAFNP